MKKKEAAIKCPDCKRGVLNVEPRAVISEPMMQGYTIRGREETRRERVSVLGVAFCNRCEFSHEIHA